MAEPTEVFERFGSLLVELLVLFVVISFALALVQRWVGEERLRRVLSSRSRTLGVVKGALLGAVTPFCSCSTIPIVVGLLQAKVRFATVAAFLLASPLLNPIVLGAIVVIFGPRVAVIYGSVAFGVTMVSAALWEQFGMASQVKRVRVVRRSTATSATQTADPERTTPPAENRASVVGAGSRPVVGAEPGVQQAVQPADVVDAGGPSRPRVDVAEAREAGAAAEGADAPWAGISVEAAQAWRYSLSLLRQMLLPLLIGVAVGALIYGVVPTELLARVAGPGDPLAIVVAAVAGIPLYVRAVAALPIGSALYSAGVGLGPIFALIIGGAGASIPEVSLLTGIFKPKLVIVFVATILLVAITGGFAVALLA